MEDKIIRVPATLKADGPEGTLEAVFSTFGIVDSDGDIVQASAFTDGQRVPLTWAHDWTMPIGKGAIRVESDRAIFTGQFNLNTTWGRDAYASVKDMGDLQEYSWGFRVLDADFAERESDYVRVITKADVYEVSPVLVGANRDTRTLTLKGGQRFADEAEMVLATIKGFADRAKALAAAREKDGRMLSAANRDRLQGHRDALKGVVADLEDLLAASASDTGKSIDIRALYAEWQRTEARLNGVAV